MRGNDMKRIIHLVPFIVFLIFIGGYMPLHGQESVEQYLMGLDEPSKEDYIQLLYEGSHENQVLAITKLAEMADEGDEEVFEALIFGLQQGTIYVKRQYNKVVNDFWDVRAASAYALGELGNPEALPHLYLSLRYDPDNHVRAEVAAAIGKIGDPDSIPILERVIETSSAAGPDDAVVLGCVEALGEIGHRDGFVPLLEVMRGDFRRSIRLAARDSMKKIRW
jgi:HEAT repeat protein